MKRSGSAVWKGSGKDGTGTLDTFSGALSGLPYSAKLRFENEDGTAGTNPEELIGAAHAGCFAMAAAFAFSAAGHPPEELRAKSNVSIEKQTSGWKITGIVLELDATVPGISDDDFHRIAAEAKANCPVSRALSVPIEIEARRVKERP